MQDILNDETIPAELIAELEALPLPKAPKLKRGDSLYTQLRGVTEKGFKRDADIPAVALGRACRWECSKGHEHIFVISPVTCATRGCKAGVRPKGSARKFTDPKPERER